MTFPGSPPPSPVVTVIQHSPDVPLDRFVDWLADGDGSRLDVAVVRAWAGESVPTEPSDALIVLGGHMHAHADDVAPWLPATRALLAAAVAADVPTLGICLGAQLLAAATGGRVQVAAPPGREAGIVDVRWRPDAAGDPVLAALAASGRSAPLPSMHADAIVDLPRGAVWLGSSAMYPYQAFRLGRAWGVQFHPEAGAATFRGWAQAYDDVDAAAVMALYEAREPEIAAAGRAIAAGFAAVVHRTADERAAQSVTRSSASMIV
ncbi:type 1 glutamine amidotransferase [Pengzhenrongella frigida]|uniref:Type 1 glutamine amidotransferase n=1 Tax=Pengzhenrongella frigida TaxID=1259133 RepID=A0A4Q5N5A5_9MICO|nr:type 1 glutamine amidotransferase [Cellulomonas sp. HLT2-17]RYV51261.1 type 1 glutamine amidotransferase [Cellulomonas sp. HLT2-17]